MPFIGEEKPTREQQGLAPREGLESVQWRESQNQADRIGLLVLLGIVMLATVVTRIIWVKRRRIAANAEAAATSATAIGIRAARGIRARSQKFAERAIEKANRPRK